MGWAKYYEDNVSICIGRMAVIERNGACIREEASPVKKKQVAKQAIIPKDNIFSQTVKRPIPQGGRRGIELSFKKIPGEKMLRQLQMNGWWWSRANSCWCNMDTKANRSYVRRILKNTEAQVVLVA